MTKWFDNLIRNAREGALEAVGELLQLCRNAEDEKIRLMAIKEVLRLVTTKEALKVAERQIEEYPIDIQEQMLVEALEDIKRKRASRAVQHETVQ